MSSRSAERLPGREHIPIYPTGFVTVRIIQLVIAIICLGLTAYTVAVLPISGAALMLFTAIVSLGTSIYLLVAHFGPPKSYNYWAIMSLDIFHVLFWLVSFGLLAAQAAALFVLGSSYYYDDYYYSYGDGYSLLGAISAAAAGLGGVQWVSYLVSLIIHSVALHRHRKAGLHSSPNGGSSGPGQAVAGAPAGVEKYQMQPQQPQAHYPPPSNVPQDGSAQQYQQQSYQQPPYEQNTSPSPYQQQPYQQQAYQQPPYQQQPEQHQ